MDRELIGKVKRLVSEKGFGFIGVDGVDYFFHRSSCDDFNQLREGDRVAFISVQGNKGPRADRVRRT